MYVIPETISHYRILSKLGAGGMGEVYLAEDVRLSRKVALKMLPADITTDVDRVRRFQQEARAASALNHPNILTIYDIGEIDSLHFIVTEFVKGVTLRERLSSTDVSLQEALNIAIQVASALVAAHQAGIIHRDIKPENIMIRPDGYVKVLDFGLAKLIEHQIPPRAAATPNSAFVKTEPGLVMGTPRYMSPEQARGLVVDGRTDVFSLSIVLYEMITGRAPFEGSTVSDVIVAILQNEPPPIQQYSAVAPPELQRIVGKALRKDAEARYQTVEAFLTDLDNLRLGLSKQSGPEDSTQTDLNSEATGQMGSKQPGIEPGQQTEGISPTSKSGTPPMRIRRSRQVIDSVAILPLANASADPNMEYLSDGITETIINRLSKLPKLRVMAHSTVFRYKGRPVYPQQVGKDLKVRAVLTGRVILLGNRLIISTELVDVSDGSQLWGEQYNRELSDIFGIGGEISREISDKLELKLTGAEQKRLTKRYTDNSEAYQSYLRGRYFLNKFISQTLDINDLRSAEKLFEKAIEVDPIFALAHSSLGVCYLNHVLKGIGGIEYYAKAKDAFSSALAIDPKLIEPRVRNVYIDLFEGRSGEARQEIRRLMRSAPNEPSIYPVAAYVYRLSGQYEQSLEAWDKFLKIAPTDVVFASYNRARLYLYQQDYAKAEEEITKGLDFEPHHPNLLAYNALLDFYRGDVEKATIALEDSLAKNPDIQSQKLFLALCYVASGESGRGFALIDEQVIQSARADQDIAYRLATMYALDNQSDEAVKWLELAISIGNENYPWFAVNPNWEAVRDDARYKSIMESLKTKFEHLSRTRKR